ncbi:MAG: carboxymuconolactone decarboxylase family protein, partial [Cellvibrio sp.]|nr:carboxymuconolactone decarboxylase family protein [Cellvibrio sp.]
MQQRIKQPDVYKIQPALLKSLVSLGDAAASELEHSLIHLVKL